MPAHWLYVSKKLDLFDVPNEAPWMVDCFTVGSVEQPVPIFRVTARVVAWLEACGSQLERECVEGRTDRGQLDSYYAAMTEVWVFANRHLDPDVVRVARRGQPSLPDPPVPK